MGVPRMNLSDLGWDGQALMGSASESLQRRAVEALERIANALQPQPAPATPGSCPHCQGPEEKQVDASTMGTPGRKQCLLCRAEYDG